jgi:hypothetical protein
MIGLGFGEADELDDEDASLNESDCAELEEEEEEEEEEEGDEFKDVSELEELDDEGGDEVDVLVDFLGALGVPDPVESLGICDLS